MNNAHYRYDEASDTLSITFPPSEQATGVELTDHIIVHINKTTHRLVRITLLDYSVLVQQTAFGPRTFPVTGFATMNEEERAQVLDVLQEQTVKEILHISAYTPEEGQIAPIIRVQPVLATTE